MTVMLKRLQQQDEQWFQIRQHWNKLFSFIFWGIASPIFFFLLNFDLRHETRSIRFIPTHTNRHLKFTNRAKAATYEVRSVSTVKGDQTTFKINIKRPLDNHSEQVKYTVHRMLWHADILEYNASVTFREKATGDLLNLKENHQTKPTLRNTTLNIKWESPTKNTTPKCKLTKKQKKNEKKNTRRDV